MYQHHPSMPASAKSLLPTEELAFEIVAFIAGDEQIFSSFLNSTGASVTDLQRTLETPETHAALLDFLLDQEPLLLEFCAASKRRPESLWKARQALPGFSAWDSA